MLTASCERAPDAAATNPTPQASCSRPGSSAAAAGTAAWGWGRSVEREPAGWIRCPGAAMVPPAGGAPAAGEAGIGAQKKARLRSGAGRAIAAHALVYPVAPPERTRLRRMATGSVYPCGMNVLLYTRTFQSSGCRHLTARRSAG